MVHEIWKEGCVGDLLHGLESGVSVNGEDREFDNSEFAVLKVSSVSYGIFNPRAAKVITGDQLERARVHPKQGQVIISRSNTEAFVGASAYIHNDYPNLFLPDKLWQTKPKTDANMKWLSYVLASDYARYSLSNLATGTSGSMKNITKGELLSLKLNIPPSSEQKKMAQLLSTWDKAITTTEQLLANNQQQKKALMQQLLTGKKRLLDENGEQFSGEWNSIAIRELGKVVTGTTPPKNDKKNYGDYLPWATAEDFKQKYIKSTKVKLSEQGCKKARIVPSGSILVTCIASIGLNAIASESLATNQQINAIIVANGYSNEFIFYQLNKNKHKLMSLAGTTAVPIVNKSSFEKLALLIPSYSEQIKIASILVAQDEVIDKLEYKINYLKQEKKALMQQLLTGKRRVKVDGDVA